MTTKRENVIWDSPDGTWNRGFFEQDFARDDLDLAGDWVMDPDVFHWASTGHGTIEAAYAAWTGLPVSDYTLITRAQDPATCERYDRMAAEAIERRAAARHQG